MSPHTQPPDQSSRRARSSPLLGWLALCFVLAATGCAAPARPKVRLAAYSWWKRPSEQRAFENVLRIYNSSQSQAEAFNEVSDTNADAVRSTLTALLLAGAAPSTFQANAGADLLRWSVVDTDDPRVPSSTRIAPLTDQYKRNELFDALPPLLIQALSAGPNGGLPYAVPINIHRLNMMYYNAVGLAQFGERNSGSSFLDPAVLCPPDLDDKLADPNARLDLNIAVGTDDDFALTLFALETVLPAVAGAPAYDQLFHGRPTTGWEEPVRHALRCVQYLSRSFLDDRDKSWADALAQVQTGSADFSVMGDWANGELKTALDSGQVIAQPFPGSEAVFVFTSDTFPLPVEAPYAADSAAFLDTIASREAQYAFSLEKGSIPARNDVDVSGLGPLAVQSRADFYSDDITKELATSGLFPPYYPSELNERLAAMTKPGADQSSVDDVIDLLRDAEPLLDRWQKRMAGR